MITMIRSPMPVVAALLVGVTAWPAPASALTDDELAKQYFLLGEEAYNRAEYVKALELFQQSHHYSKKPELVFDMARCHEALGQAEKAIEEYERYLASGATAQGKQVRSRIENLKRGIALRKLEEQKGREHERRRLEERADQRLHLERERMVEERESRDRLEVAHQRSSLRRSGWALVGVGAALMATGGLFCGLARWRSSQMEDANQDWNEYTSVKYLETQGKAFQTSGIVSLAFGGAAAIVGVVLLVVHAKGRPAPHSAFLAPSVSPGGLVASRVAEF
jgi:tetratricopeptide (TPR) repeat protein